MLFLLVTVSVFANEQSLGLDDVVERHTRAIGGRQAIEAVQSIEMALLIEEPSFKVRGVYTADRKQRMRIDIYDGDKLVFTEGFDGTRGWQRKGPSKPVEDSSEQGSAALWHGTVLPGKLYGLHEQKELGGTLELQNRQRSGNVNFYVLKLTLKDGYTIHYYINPTNWLIERSRTIAPLHPDVDPTEIVTETHFSDFRSVNGVIRAFRSKNVDVATGKMVQSVTLTSVKTNPRVEDGFYNKPK